MTSLSLVLAPKAGLFKLGTRGTKIHPDLIGSIGRFCTVTTSDQVQFA